MYPVRASENEFEAHPIRLVGGVAAIAKDSNGGGFGISVSRTGTGAYRLTWSQNPGQFLGWSVAIGAATPGDVSGHTVVRNVYDQANRRLDFVLYNATPAAHDLAADEYLDIVVYFKG